MAGLENTTSNLLTVSRITWSGGRLQSAMLGGTNGTLARDRLWLRLRLRLSLAPTLALGAG